MNKAHCVVWSDSHHAFIVTHEHAASRGKASSTRRALGAAVALGLGSLIAAQAMASGSCANSGASTVQGATSLTCTLASGGTLSVTPSGKIQASGPGVLINAPSNGTAPMTVNNTLLVRNAGQITGSDGILVEHAAASGSLSVLGTGLVSSNAKGGSALAVREASLGGSIVNSGRIDASASGGTAIELTRAVLAGNVDNRNALAGAVGVGLKNSTVSGAISNRGNIAASGSALYADQSRVDGNISLLGSASGGTHAVWLSNDTLGGSVTNSGSVLGKDSGILLSNTALAGNLVNSGRIEAATALEIDGGNAGSLRNSGTLNGSQFGVQITQADLKGGVTNSGTLAIVAPGKASDPNANIGNALNINLSTVAKDISNSGTISGGSLGGGGVKIGGSKLNGNVLNSASGVITGADQGVHLFSSNLKGSILNDGVITGTLGSGLRVTTSLVRSGINNTGSITGASEGVLLGQGSVSKDILNSGLIKGGSKGLALTQLDAGGNLVNSGTLSGGTSGLSLDRSRLASGSLINDGAVLGGIALSGSTIGKDVRNNGTVSNTVGVSGSTIGGALVNTGTLLASSGPGLLLSNRSSIGNGITNSGSLLGGPDGAALSVQNSLIRNGGIRNTVGASVQGGSGLLVSNSTITGAINNSGMLSYKEFSQGAGLELAGSTLTGNLLNDGTIIGSPALNVHQSSINGSINNSGELQGYATAAQLTDTTVTGDVRNSGTVTGRLNAFTLLNSSVSGKVINSGYMASRNNGLSVNNSTITGGITNSGSMSSLNGNSVTNSSIGNFVNTGTIGGGFIGVTFDSSQVSGALINSGTLGGGRFAVLSDATSLTRLVITGNDTAVFQGEVEAPGAHVSVASGATYTLLPGNLFTVADFTNYGVLGLAATSAQSTATVSGDYVQKADATLRTQVVDASTYGKLAVGGTASLPSQAKIYVDVVNSGQAFGSGRLNDVISAGNLKSDGTFAVTSNSQLFNFNGIKDGNSVDLGIAPKSASGVSDAVQSQGKKANLSAARALDSGLASNGGLSPFFVGATNSAQVASAVSQTLPSNAVAATQVSQSTLSTITDVVQSRIDANTGLASGDGFYGDKNLWMKPFGSWINQSERGDSPGYDASVYGMAFGVDAPVNELLRLGVSFSYANADTNSKADVSSQSAKVDLYQLMGYGSYTVAPNTELSFHAGVGQNRNDGERNINLNGIGGKASANYDSRSVTAGVALAKAFDISPTTRFIPSVRADYTWLQDDSYSEKGSAALQPLLLKVDKHQTDQLIVGLDGKLSHEIVPGTQVTGNLGIGYDVIHDDSMLTSTYAGAPGQSFNTVGQSSSPWLARGGVGLSTKIASNGTELSVNYDGEVRTDFTNQTVSLKVKMPF
jgi:outer membrane autotransporter protein